jgi:hypothetical protein
MEAYEFYWRDSQGKDHLIGILPERRKDPKRISNGSIVNWARKVSGRMAGLDDIFFITVTIEKG